MVGWYHRCKGCELGQTLGDTEGWGSLVYHSLWGHEESDMTWQLNNHQCIRTLSLRSKVRLRNFK